MQTTTATVGGTTLAVRFLRAWQQYYPGDVAAFPRRMAYGLVRRSVAQPVNIAKATAEIPPESDLARRPPGKMPERRDPVLDEL